MRFYEWLESLMKKDLCLKGWYSETEKRISVIFMVDLQRLAMG